VNLTVACVLRSGGIYRPEWVTRLQRQVKDNLTIPHHFICLSDVHVPCDRIGLRHSWPRWWSKIELFRRELFQDRVLYLDLDSLIVGPLDPLVSAGGFWMTQDFLGPGFNSGCMFWGGDRSEIYRRFVQDAAGYARRYDAWPDGRIGDQAFIEDVMHANAVPIRPFAPGLVVSWKKDARAGPPPGASVVSFHGRRKMPDCPGWARDAWERAA
jgi:hypothetical protein